MSAFVFLVSSSCLSILPVSLEGAATKRYQYVATLHVGYRPDNLAIGRVITIVYHYPAFPAHSVRIECGDTLLNNGFLCIARLTRQLCGYFIIMHLKN